MANNDIIGIGTISIYDLNDSSLSTTPPARPETGQIWIDSSGDRNVLKQWDGNKWIIAELDVTQLDKDLSETITSIEATLGNIGDDGILTHSDRKLLVEELIKIIGETLSTSRTIKYPDALPDYTLVDSNASGSFANYRFVARDAGVEESETAYVYLEQAYTTMINYLANQSGPKPWDIRTRNKDTLTELDDGDNLREVLLDYYLAELSLVTLTEKVAQDKLSEVSITDKTEILSGNPIYTDKADDESVVHVGVVGKSKHKVPVGEKIGESAVDDIEIGGRNLLLNSDSLVFDGSDQGNIRLTVDNGDYFSITPINNGNIYNIRGFKTSIGRIQGETYTFSIEVNTLESMRMYYRPSESYNSIGVPNTNGEWHKLVFTYTQTGETKRGDVGFLVGFHSMTAGLELKYRNPQIERGTKATDWTPAPEDVEDNLQSVNNLDIISQKTTVNGESAIDGLEIGGRNLLPTNPNLYTSGTYIHYKFQDKPMEYLATLEDKDTEVDMSGVFIVITTQENPNGAASTQWFMINGVEIVRERKGKNELYFSVYPGNIETLEKVFKRYRIKIERNTNATDWTPAPEDNPYDILENNLYKTNILLSEPLRSVGDVKDRLFRDEDGKWKVERNVNEVIMGGNYQKVTGMNAAGDFRFGLFGVRGSNTALGVSYAINLIRGLKSTHFAYNNQPNLNTTAKLNHIGMNGLSGTNAHNLHFSVDPVKFPTLSSFNDWLDEQESAGNPVRINYEMREPFTETLPQDLQNKLNNIASFSKGNSVYTILPDKSDILQRKLQPELHATFKSKGWYRNYVRDIEAKEYTDSSTSNSGTALDVPSSGAYEIPKTPVSTLTEYTLEALVYWKGEDHSGILGRKSPELLLGISLPEYEPIRYIRSWSNGSSANNNNHVIEIQAIDTEGTNVALGAPVTSSSVDATRLEKVTDGKTASGSSDYANLGSGEHYVDIDLGRVYPNIKEIKVWRYYSDGRTYNDTALEVSYDKDKWVEIYDGTSYAETSSGKSFSTKLVSDVGGQVEYTLSNSFDLNTVLDSVAESEDSETLPFYLARDKWKRVSITYDGLKTQIYVDGQLTAEKSGGEEIDLAEISIGLGRGDTLFNGYISDVRVWQKALSEEEIYEYYSKRLSGSENGLVLNYRLNGGNLIYDSGPYGIHIETEGGIGWVENSKALQDMQEATDDEIDKKIEDSADELQTTWSAEFSNFGDSLRGEVQELNTNLEDEIANVYNSFFELDIGSFNIGSMESGGERTLEDVLGSLESDNEDSSEYLNNLRSFFSFDLEDERFIIGTPGGGNQMILTSEELGFYNGGEKVAHISNQRMLINQGIFVEELIVGQHKMSTKENGVTVFSYEPLGYD